MALEAGWNPMKTMDIKGLPNRRIAIGLQHAVFVELPAWQLLLLAAAVGITWAASMFDWSFIAGRHAFWQFPAGTIRYSQLDMAQVLVAYYYYVQAPWNLPLFYVTGLGIPTGTNIIMMDAVPVVALLGKLTDSLIGVVVNPYGAFLFLCFALPGVMMGLVLIASRVRYALAAIIGAIFADSMPALLSQWGHIALEAHFLLVGALALYLLSFRERGWRTLEVVWVLWLVLGYLINMYFFVMVGVVWFCMIVQRWLNGCTTLRHAFLYGSLSVAAVVTVIALGGQFGAGSGLPFFAYGDASMNLLSPIVPQYSGLVPWMGGIIDATGAQYEGYNYLGLGLLLSSLLLLPREASWLRRNARRHAALLVALACLTAYAISHRVYAGQWLLFELPMSHILNRVLGVFRGSGRFFWLVSYAQIAVLLVLAFRRAHLLIVLGLACAALLQVLDLEPLREQVVTSIAAGPVPEPLDSVEVARLVSGAARVEVIPSIQCTDGGTEDERMIANMELMLATARANVPTNTVYLARQTYGLTLQELLHAPSMAGQMFLAHRSEYCKRESDIARNSGRLGDIFVFLSDQPTQQEMAPGISCSPLSWARYCWRSKE
jgi:hypothetical protein